MHPNDPIFHTKLAHEFLKDGHEILAILQARRAYKLLIHQDPGAAKELVNTFGEDVASTPTRPFVGEDYSPLAKTFGLIKRKMNTIHIKEGATLFHQGERADYIYLLNSGELAVYNTQGKATLLNHLYPGSLLGEGAMHEGKLRMATIAATQDSTLLRMTREELQQAFQKHPDLQISFSKEVLIRQRVVMLSTSPVFSTLPTDLRFILAKRAWTTTLAAGSCIKEANKAMPNIELVTKGKVQLYQDNAYCGSLKAGAILGLHNIMGGKTSKLRYVAGDEYHAIGMDFLTINDLMSVSSNFRERMRDTAAAFSTQTARTMSLQES